MWRLLHRDMSMFGDTVNVSASLGQLSVHCRPYATRQGAWHPGNVWVTIPGNMQVRLKQSLRQVCLDPPEPRMGLNRAQYQVQLQCEHAIVHACDHGITHTAAVRARHRAYWKLTHTDGVIT